jgi:hypothetical protein
MLKIYIAHLRFLLAVQPMDLTAPAYSDGYTGVRHTSNSGRVWLDRFAS